MVTSKAGEFGCSMEDIPMLTPQRNKLIIISMSMLMTWRRPWIGELKCMDCQTPIGLFNALIWTLHQYCNKLV